MSIILNNTTNYSNNNIIYQELRGGLGNQFLCILNIYSLALEYDKDVILSYIENEKRKCFTYYSFFKNIKKSNILNDKIIKEFKTIKEKSNNFKFKKIKLPPNKNIVLKGYFQSFKYWWNYKENIKDIIYIDYDRVHIINEIYKNIGNKILSIHIRLDDYYENEDFFYIQNTEYLKKALSFYNLNNYKIILFSDDIELASEMIKPIEINYIIADSISKNEEFQMYMLMLSDICICTNSTFSLMSSYLNEIYKFKPKAEYIYPSKWFNNKYVKYRYNDYMINNRFIQIDINNISFKQKYDVITPLHQKDLSTYKKYLNTNIKFLNESSNFYYISDKDYQLRSNFINENKYPFSKKCIEKYLKNYIPLKRCGWYYQQLLKLYIFKIDNKFKQDILILDADIIFLKPITLYKNNIPSIHYIDLLENKKNIHEPYSKTMNYLFSNLRINKNESGICHHILFRKELLNEMLNIIEIKFKKPAWRAIIDSIIYYVNKNKYNISIFSEYELYFKYIKQYRNKKYNYIKFNNKFKDINISNFDFGKKNNNLIFIGNHSWKK